MLISIQPRRDIPFRASSLSGTHTLPALPGASSSSPSSSLRSSTFRSRFPLSFFLLPLFLPAPPTCPLLLPPRSRPPSFSGTKLNLAGGNSSLSTVLPAERAGKPRHRRRDRYCKNPCSESAVYEVKGERERVNGIRFHDGDAAKRNLGLRKLPLQFYNYALPRLRVPRRPFCRVSCFSELVCALKEPPRFLVPHISVDFIFDISVCKVKLHRSF